MSDYWVKIVEKEDEDIRRHHYMVTANDIKEARRVANEFIRHFCDEDDDPEILADGFAFCNRAITVHVTDIKETTKEEFMNFLLKIHTIQWQ